MEWFLEIALLVLLAVTLFHAVRLERALGVLRRDRAALEELVAGFNESTRQAEQGVERLRAATDGAGRQIARQIEAAGSLKDDLLFLTERGERLADRLDALVRAGRALAPEPSRLPSPEPARSERPRPELPHPEFPRAEMIAAGPAAPPAPAGDEMHLRSQAERDLLRALRLSR